MYIYFNDSFMDSDPFLPVIFLNINYTFIYFNDSCIDSDPFLPLIFLVNSYVPAVVDVIFQSTFISALLLYWLCIYHGVRQVR